MNIGSVARGAILGVVSASLLAGVTGCDNKLEECNRLSGKLNAVSDKYKALPELDHDPAKFESTSEKYTEKYSAVFSQGKKEIGALHFRHEKLNGFVKDFMALATEAETSANDMKSLVKALVGDANAVEPQKQAWADALDALKKQCVTQSADCVAVEKVLSKAPPADNPKKMLAGLEAQSAALDRLKLEDKNVSKSAAGYSGAIKAVAKSLAVMIAIQDKMGKLGKTQAEIEKKEDALVDRVNRYCHE